jgi:small-conductance mechanosensitive channel
MTKDPEQKSHCLESVLRRLAILPAFLLCAAAAQAPTPAQQPKREASDLLPSSAQLTPSAATSAEKDVIDHLTAVLAWYREVKATDGWSTFPADDYYRANQHDFTSSAVSEAFSYGRGMVAVLSAEAAKENSKQDSHEQRLSSRIISNADEASRLKDQLASLNDQLSEAGSAKKSSINAQKRLVQAQLLLDSAVAEALKKAVSVAEEASGSSSGVSLSAKVSALQKSVPEIFDAEGKPAAKSGIAQPTSKTAGGLLNRAVELFSLAEHRHSLDQMISKTMQLRASTDEISRPIGARIRSSIQEAEDAARSATDSTDASSLDHASSEIAALADLVRRLSASVLPLRAEAAALDQSEANLVQWRTALTSESDAILRGLLSRTIALAVALAVLVSISELWRRATFKYIHDARRRRQFLLIRRFATATLMVIVIIMGFVSNFSSIATFAGFITAGIAVALQTIILSVAAYFFLIGRFGVRVGDRVTVSGVTGDVIDIGLVRVFLMELAGTGVDLHPTGRVVVLANSALFSSNPLYKQLPGTNFAWHEVYAGMAADADAAPVKASLLAAVEKVYSSYKSSIVRQHGDLERLLDYKTELPIPGAQVRLSDAGIEVVVRYPAEIRRMAEVDEAVATEVRELLRRDETLKKSLTSMPKVRAAVKS